MCKPDKTLSTYNGTEIPLNEIVHLPVTYQSETMKLNNLKTMNKAIFPDKYPLPTLEELSAEFHHSTLFTKLDMK